MSSLQGPALWGRPPPNGLRRSGSRPSSSRSTRRSATLSSARACSRRPRSPNAGSRTGQSGIVSGERGSSRTSETKLLFDAGETKAVVVDRGELDREMAAAAANAGAEFRLKAPVLRVNGDRVVTGGPGAGEVGFRILIAADGPKGTVARSLGMTRAPTHLAGVQADIIMEDPVETRYVDIHPNAAPEFFAWRIPVLGAGRACRTLWRDLGPCTLPPVPRPVSGPGRSPRHGHDPARDHAQDVWQEDPLRRRRGWPGQAHLRRRSLHRRPLGPVRGRDGCLLHRGRRLLGQGTRCGTRRGGGPTSGESSPSGTASSSARRRIAPEEIDRLLRAFSSPRVIRAIVEYGDMDRPSALLARLVRMPALWPVLPIIMRLGIAEILGQDPGK